MMDLKLTPYWKIYADLFTFMKESLPVEAKEDYWRRTIEKSCKIADAYENTDQSEFVSAELRSILAELSRIYEREVKKS